MSAPRFIQNCKYTAILICVSIMFATGVLVQQAHATTLPPVSSQQALLNSLIAKLYELQAQLAALQAANGCPYFARSLSFGMSGSDVSALQTFLARDASIYPERAISGYYDEATVRAVQRYQYREGIVRSGSPVTTGYGSFGPYTRSYIQSHYTTSGYNPQYEYSGDLDGDLSLYSIDIDHDTWDTNEVTDTELQFSVRNTSEKNIAFKYRVSFDAEDSNDEEPDDMYNTVYIGADTSKEVPIDFDESDFTDNGTFKITVEIDPDDVFDEDSESNNIRSIILFVSGINSTNDEEDDFVLSNLDIETDSWDTEDDDKNTVSFEIVNTFDDDENVEYAIVVRNDDTGVVAQSYKGTVRVDSFDSVSITQALSATNLVEDDYEVTVTLDPDDNFNEENEVNNEDDINFDVTDVQATAAEIVDLKIGGSDTPPLLQATATTTISWNTQNVTNCALTINRRPNSIGGFYSKTTAVSNTGSVNYTVTDASPHGALSAAKLDCARHTGGQLSDYIGINLTETTAAYRYYEGSVLKQETANLTEYTALALCKTSAKTAVAKPWCGWNGKVIYGTKPAGWTAVW